MLIFAGTAEGRTLCERLDDAQAAYTACVTTEYGQVLLNAPNPKKKVIQERMDKWRMAQLMREGELVVDATHPYADQASRNIMEACAATRSRYIRVLRSTQEASGKGVERVKDTAGAVEYLNSYDEKALLGVGAKELSSYTAVTDFQKRLYPRVLPALDSVKICHDLGFFPAHIIAMQGPFSHELNVAMLNSAGAKIFVTKDTGEAGGFSQKLSAAQDVGATLLVIGRPREENGLSIEDVWELVRNAKA